MPPRDNVLKPKGDTWAFAELSKDKRGRLVVNEKPFNRQEKLQVTPHGSPSKRRRTDSASPVKTGTQDQLNSESASSLWSENVHGLDDCLTDTNGTPLVSDGI